MKFNNRYATSILHNFCARKVSIPSIWNLFSWIWNEYENSSTITWYWKGKYYKMRIIYSHQEFRRATVGIFTFDHHSSKTAYHICILQSSRGAPYNIPGKRRVKNAPLLVNPRNECNDLRYTERKLSLDCFTLPSFLPFYPSLLVFSYLS